MDTAVPMAVQGGGVRRSICYVIAGTVVLSSWKYRWTLQMRLANMTNGLAYPHDRICYFQSQYAHQMKLGYFNHTAMPLDAVVHLLKGGKLWIIDATQHNRLSDALKFGVPTWCAVFNRATRIYPKPCDWFTKEMQRTSMSKLHKPIVQTYRKLIKIYGYMSPAVIGITVFLECYKGIEFDDKPEVLKDLVQGG